MAQISRSTKVGGGTTLQANSSARAADVETDVLALFSAHNNHDTGTSKWTVVSAENSASTVGIFNNSTGTNDILDCRDNGSSVFKVTDGGIIPSATITAGTITTATVTTLTYALLGYRRPVLKWISATTVEIENNTGTSNQTTIIFPDGSVRSVTEDTASTNKYRSFNITADAEFTTGTEDSGLRAALSEATNTWYAIYAVKSTINASNFVLVGDTVLPLQANFATLNSAYGTNGWVYLGLIRNGDNSGATGDILRFKQAGAITMFTNSCDSVTGGVDSLGIRLANTAAAGTLDWTYAAGTGAAEVPANVTMGQVTANLVEIGSSGNVSLTLGTATGAQYLSRSTTTSTDQGMMTAFMNLDQGIQSRASTDDRMSIHLTSFVDGVLGVGGNPLL